MELLAEMEAHVDAVRQAVAGLSPDTLGGSDAARVVALGVAVERLGASMRTRFARRVTQTRTYERTGHRSAATWLAEVAGEPVGRARSVLETAGHLVEAPEVDQAFATGQLSFAQAQVAAEAGALDPSAQGALVGAATGSGSFQELRDQAARVKRRHYGEVDLARKEARAHRGRYVRTWQPEVGGMRLEAWLPTAEGARIRAVLDQEADRVFHEARQAGRRELPERCLADALVRVVTAKGGERPGERPSTQVTLRVDAAALRRGEVHGDEVCEIPGVGPVPVAVARDLLGDAVFRVVVTEGTDVRCVTSHRRTIPGSLRSALYERDRTCAVPGCTVSRHLEIDHLVDFAHGGPTELANLALLCKVHHAMKTHQGFYLDGPPEARRWVGPDQRVMGPDRRGSPGGQGLRGPARARAG
jgi:hypothetical protein